MIRGFTHRRTQHVTARKVDGHYVLYKTVRTYLCFNGFKLFRINTNHLEL